MSQIRDSELGEYDNPAAQSFIDKIKANIEPLPSTHQLSKLSKLASEAANYIHDVVWALLVNTPNTPNTLDYFSFMGDACKDQELGIDVFTLNHDTLLEQYFNNHKIKFTDGFDSPVNDVRYWKPELFDGEISNVRLFKLHGSVDWFRLEEGLGIIPLGGDRWYSKNRNGEMQYLRSERTEFLAGSFNKILQYVEPPYDDLLCWFLKGLRETSRLVICGYSFGDKGINTRLLDWVYSAAENKIVLIHPEPVKLRESARGAIANKDDLWGKKMSLIKSYIQNANWPEIKASL